MTSSVAATEESRKPFALARMFSAMQYRDFRLIWIGAFTSTVGTWMQTMAQAWVVYRMTNSPLLLGFDAFLSTGPMLLFSLFGGVIADRVERRKIMLASQWLQMLFAIVLALLLWSHTIKIWQIFIMSFLTGSVQSFSGPAYASLLPLLVKREDVPNAVAMNSMQFNLARVIGPTIGGVAMAAWGAAICFALNALSFLPIIIAYMMINTPVIRGEGHQRTGIMAEMRQGFAFVTSRKALVILTFLALAGTFLGMPMLTMFPVVAKEFFHGGPKTYSYLIGIYGLGSFVGALFVAASSHYARKAELALLLQIGFATLLVAFAFTRIFPLSLAIAFAAGVCIVGVVSLYSSLVQLATNDAMRGRVMSIFMLAFRGGMPLGSLAAGWMAQRWSMTAALAVNGSVLAIVALLFVHRGRSIDEELSPAGVT